MTWDNVRVTANYALEFKKDNELYRAPLIDVLNLLDSKIKIDDFQNAPVKWGYERLEEGQLLSILKKREG